MAQCGLCGVSAPLAGLPPEGVTFCCDACLRRAKELTAVHGQLDRAYDATLEALVAALDVRERKTGEHSRRVARYGMVLGNELGISGDPCRRMCRGALLHDIGKIGVPDAVLLKEGPLTDAEWALMRLHPELGAKILEAVPFLSAEREIVLAHQERYDGSGYPRGLKGEAIPLGARIFAVADTLDALLSDRPYHRGVPFEAASATIRAQAGITLDPAVVAALFRAEQQIRRPGLSLCVGEPSG